MEVVYEFKAGDVVTTTKPNKVTRALARAWYDTWVNLNDVSDYEVYVVGSFAEAEFGDYTGPVFDLDIALVGEVKDEVALKELLESAIEVGFSLGIMVDVWHNDVLMDLDEVKSIVQTRSYNVFSSTRTIEGRVFESSHVLWGGFATPLNSGLYQFTYTTDRQARSWIKANSRVQSGSYKGLQIKANEL